MPRRGEKGDDAAVGVADEVRPRQEKRLEPNRLVLAGKVAAVGLFGFATSAATAMLASFLMGALSTVGLVIWMTLIHERVQGDLLGRVNSIDWLVSTSLMPVALAIVGPLADAFGVRALLGVAGFGGALLVLSFLLVPGVLTGEELRDRLEPT